MFSDFDIKLMVYVILGAAAIMAAAWFFLIAPWERRDYERKMAVLQQKIKAHEEAVREAKSKPDNGSDAQGATESD
jgi:hypothetical protein